MMDNLQLHYLGLLESALESALHGNVSRCLDVLFDLRLRSDLAFYTRAQVSLMLANLIKPGQHPRRLEFAKEALRLAIELNEVVDVSKDTLWADQYTLLLQSSREAVEKVAREEHEYLRANTAVENDMRNLQLQDNEQSEQELVFVGAGDEPEVDGWDIEGAFSVKLGGGAKEDASATSKPGASTSETEQMQLNPGIVESDDRKKTGMIARHGSQGPTLTLLKRSND